MRTKQQAEEAVEKYGDTVKRISMVHLKSISDTEDVFQNVFLKYIQYTDTFKSEEHEKAWIIRVTINTCKDTIKSFFRKNTVSIDDVLELEANVKEEYKEVLEAVLSLPEKYKDVVYLHYYENYTAPEISDLLKRNVNTIYTLLTRSRVLLKNKLKGEWDE